MQLGIDFPWDGVHFGHVSGGCVCSLMGKYEHVFS